MLTVGYFQFRPRFGDVAHNTRQVVTALAAADADVVVLPELAFTGYLFGSREECRALAEEPARSPTVAALVALARERRMHVVTGFAERARDRVFNSALLIGPRGVVRTYRKLHLFNEEKRWFDPGDLPPAVDRVRGVGLGLMICFDWIFPELARTLALAGADLLCHPSNLVLAHCQRAMVTRCLENGVFAVTANRFGEERRAGRDLRFTGHSQVVSPAGVVLQRAPAQRRELGMCRIDPAEARGKRITPRNHVLRDRRPELYRL